MGHSRNTSSRGHLRVLSAAALAFAALAAAAACQAPPTPPVPSSAAPTAQQSSTAPPAGAPGFVRDDGGGGPWFTPVRTHRLLADDGLQNQADIVVELGTLDRLDRMPPIGSATLGPCSTPDGRNDPRIDAAVPVRITTTNRNPSYPMDISVNLQKGTGLSFPRVLVFAEFDGMSFTCHSADFDARGLQEWYRPLGAIPGRFVGYVIVRRYFASRAATTSGSASTGATSTPTVRLMAGGVNLPYGLADSAREQPTLYQDIQLISP